MSSELNMLIIRDENGEVIGARIDEPNEYGIVTFITPSTPSHTLYQVSDFPREIAALTDPNAFQTAINGHVRSIAANLTLTTADELNAQYSRLLDAQGK
ncbi:hypothetical protein FY036_15835 [Mesorhizobium microcysteis]|uniref:Uncharacterized protein n=1 Tax=Neoaquamicrobium microcysteis TaxID=2682781 RepID=A0A5D4GPX5_9HYPH|nr:hypothetical protein [Mesorhizobium microcysteis]TYR30921.1 hypothetical protein FY036_15835 [Mesorhizobium microcysteis]